MFMNAKATRILKHSAKGPGCQNGTQKYKKTADARMDICRLIQQEVIIPSYTCQVLHPMRPLSGF